MRGRSTIHGSVNFSIGKTFEILTIVGGLHRPGQCGELLGGDESATVCHLLKGRHKETLTLLNGLDEGRRLHERITSDVKAALPDMEVRQALISPVVRRNLAARGIQADSPDMALLRLACEGYDTVYIQPSTILDGEETDRKSVV